MDRAIRYAHSETLVVLVTPVPSGVKAYQERGWPCFERAVAQMISPSDGLLDLGGLPVEYQKEWWWDYKVHRDKENADIIKN